MSRGAPLAAALLLGAALPAGAQERSDKTHVDDFAVPAVETGLGIEQLDRAGETSVSVPRQDEDRKLVIPGPPAAERRNIAQVSTGAGGETAEQVNDDNTRQVATAGISSPRDSHPETVTRLGGEDRCDPGQNREPVTECQRILELRAAEFQAAEPPRLSPEQALLAERGESLEQLATTESNMRAKLAGGSDPSAESRANQELASIYLERQPEARAAILPELVDPTLPPGIAELLEAGGELPSVPSQP